MLPYILFGIYVITALGTAYLGRNTWAGFGGTLLLSILLTPLVVLVAILLLSRRLPAR